MGEIINRAIRDCIAGFEQGFQRDEAAEMAKLRVAIRDEVEMLAAAVDGILSRATGPRADQLRAARAELDAIGDLNSKTELQRVVAATKRCHDFAAAVLADLATVAEVPPWASKVEKLRFMRKQLDALAGLLTPAEVKLVRGLHTAAQWSEFLSLYCYLLATKIGMSTPTKHRRIADLMAARLRLKDAAALATQLDLFEEKRKRLLLTLKPILREEEAIQAIAAMFERAGLR